MNEATPPGAVQTPSRRWRSGQFNQFTPTRRVPLMENMKRFLKDLHEAGARLLIGTDGGFPAVFPGYSMHDELRIYVEAGLTPLEALRIASWNAAEFAQQSEQFGAIREGLRADLILLEANPLDNIANLKRRAGVMVRGRWLPEQELQRRLEEQARTFQASAAGSGVLIDRSALFAGHKH
ncbi:MAG: amidohydrolase family protein [Acidobacteriota bacterium]